MTLIVAERKKFPGIQFDLMREIPANLSANEIALLDDLDEGRAVNE